MSAQLRQGRQSGDADRESSLPPRLPPRELDEDALNRYRRLLGDDHPNTLSSARNLTISLANLGEYQQARELEEWVNLQRGM